MSVSRFFESTYAEAAAIGVGIIVLCFPPTAPDYGRLVGGVLPTSVSVAAVLAGFQTAGQAILLGMIGSGSKLIVRLREDRHLSRIVGFIWRALAGMIVFIVLAIAAQALYSVGSWLSAKHETWTLVLSMAFVYGVVASIRIMHLMMRLLAAHARDK